MNRSHFVSSPGNSRSSGSPRAFRSSLSGGGDDLHSRKNGVFLPNRTSRTDLSTDKVHRSFGNNSRIDPQVYTDAQSRGLTSRLASYYERERLDIKPIVNRLYNKAGDLPIVHLNKNDIIGSSPRNAASLSASRVRIPAPDKSNYISNMRSEILRTGSMVGNNTLVMPNAPDPHLHPSFEAMAPLDALKEISRKRIHCDEVNLSNSVHNLNSSVDRVKKQRADDQVPPQIVSKRQRDTTSPTFKQQLSTESQKKRPCTKNNDVLSSLSSSVRFAAARKNSTVQPVAAPKPIPVRAPPATTIDKPKEITSSDLSYKSDESLISETAKRKCSDAPTVQRPSPRTEHPAKPSVAKLTLFNQRYATYNRPDDRKKTNDDTDANKHDDDDDDDDDSAGISFVKPKTGISADSSVITRRPLESSKLALMLSCLSGDLDDDDQVDTIVPPKLLEEEPKKKEEIVIAKTNIPAASNIITLETSSRSGSTLPAATVSLSSSLSETAPKPAAAVVSTVSSIITPVTTTTISSTESAPKPEAILSPIATTNPVKPIQTTNAETPKALEIPNKTFSFGVTAPAALGLGTPATTPASLNIGTPKPAPLPTTGIISALPPIATTSATDPPKAFSFGLTTSPVSTNLVKDTPKATFSFGSSNAAVSTAPSTTTEVPKTTTSTPFSFGASTASSSALPSFGSTASGAAFNPSATTSLVKPTQDPTPQQPQRPALLSTPATSSVSNVTNTTSAFSFGGSTKPAAGGFNFKPTTSVQPTDTKPGAFAFGSSLQTAAPVFGSTTSPPILPTPSFGTSAQSGTSGFGTPSNNMFGASTSAPPLFESSKPITTTSAPLTFGGSFNLSAPTTTSTAPKPGGFSFNPTPATPAITTTASITPAFGSSTNATSFFSAPTTTTTAPPSFGAPAASTFGTTFAPSAVAPPSFGSSTSVFGSASANPSFGAPVTTAVAAFGSSTFGGPPSFGATTTAPSFGTSSGLFGNPATTTPAFGSSTVPSFGAAAASTTTPSFGSTTSAFGSSAPSFGAGASSPFGTPAAKPAAPTFGSPAPATSNNFFGSNTTAASNPTADKPFAFGATASATAPPPSFGATTGASTAFAFGTTSSPAQQQTPTAPFAFNANAAQPSNTTNTSAPFAFGANSNANNTGGMSNPGTASAAPPPFAFGATASAPAFAFGSGSGSSNTGSASSAATPGSNGSGGAFNFGGAANLFSATPANGGNANAVKGRPIRTATRRIFK